MFVELNQIEDSSKLYSEENFPSEVKDKNPTKKQQNCY